MKIDNNKNSASIKLKYKEAYKLIYDAVLGKENDYTIISTRRAIFLLAVPMILEMIGESIFAIADIYFVSHISPDAVATVGITESLVTLVYALAIGLSMAVTALIARRIGEKKNKEAAHVAMQAVFTGIFTAAIIALSGIFFAKDLLSLMGASDHIVENYWHYPAWMLGGNIVIMLLFINNAIFRSAGNANLSMWALWIANIINIILDPILIFGWGPIPEMGVEGAAIATNIGRGTAVIFQLVLLLKGIGLIKLDMSKFKIDFTIIGKIFKLSIGTIGQYVIATSSWIVLVRIISEFGSVAVAGYTIAIRIMLFSLLPSWGLANAATTLVGQNLGAKQPEKAEKSVWLTSLYNMIFLAFVGAIYLLFSDELISLFMRDTDSIENRVAVIEIGAECLRILSYGFIFYGVGMVLIHAFNGAGDTMTPTKINFICFWIFELPFAYLLAIQYNLGPTGVFIAIVSAETLLTVVSAIVFRRGRWKETQV